MVIFIAWIAFILLKQKIKCKCHERVCKNKGLRGIVMPSEKDNILDLISIYEFIYVFIYAVIESLIKKVDGCANNPENFSTT